MKTQGRKVLAALALCLGFVGTAGAATQDSLTVTITPNAVYAVDIDTALVVMNLGVVDLGSSVYTLSPATVQVNSSFAATDLTITAAVLTAVNPWTLDTNTATNENDALKSWAVFTDTSVTNPVTVQGLAGAFSGTDLVATDSDVLGTGSLGVGTDGSAVVRYVLSPAAVNGYKTMNAIPTNTVDAPASRAHLWLKFTLPPTSTGLGAQQVQVTLTALALN